MTETKPTAKPDSTAGDIFREVAKDVPTPKRPDQGTAADVVKAPATHEVHPSGPTTVAGEPLPTEKGK